MSDNTNRAQLLWQDLSGTQIREQILRHHGFNGEKAHAELQDYTRHQNARRWARSTAPLWFGLSAVSAYNLSRFSVLSKSGQGAAAASIIVFPYLAISALRN